MSLASKSDPYLWLEDLKSRKVTSWARAQNTEFETELKPKLPKLQSSVAKYYNATYILQAELTDAGTFFLERVADEYIIKLGRRTIVSSKDLPKDYVIFYFFVDRDGKRLAYFISKGEDYGILKVINVRTGRKIAELEGGISDVEFTKDHFYYVKNFRDKSSPDGIKPPTSRIMKGNELVFGKGIPSGQFLSIEESNGKALVTVSKWSRSDIYCGDLENPRSWKKILGADYPAYPIEYLQDMKDVLILSYDRTGNGRLFCGKNTIVKENALPLLSAAVVGNEIICHYLKDCSSELQVFGMDGRLRSRFAPEFKCSIDSISSNKERAILIGSSFESPSILFEYKKGKLQLVEKKDFSRIEVSEGYAKSKDSTPIHYFELGKKNNKHVLIHGYGGFSISKSPAYDPLFCALVEKEVSCVVANLRGGNEYGEKWHNAGKRSKKQNVFDDFAGVIKKFKKRGAKVVAYGRSNGGLLVGATITQNPYLVDGALIGYPVLDMMHFHKMLMGSAWMDEYGNPDKKGDKRYLLRYSPYHNIKKFARYPPTMIYTSLHDDRVHPGHAFKFESRLRETGSEVWLRVEQKGGHAGANSKTKIEEISDEAGFVLYCLGIAV